MTYQEFLQQLEDRLGYHQLPCNRAAGDIREVFDSSPVHTELMTRIVRAIYKHNGCLNMKATVTQQKIDEALAPIRLEVMRGANTDIDAYHLIDDICHAVSAIFSSHKQADQAPLPSTKMTAVRPALGDSAAVISLTGYRIARTGKP